MTGIRLAPPGPVAPGLAPSVSRRPGEGALVGSLLVLLAASSTSLTGFFDGFGWWLLFQAVAAATLLLAWALRRTLPAWCAGLVAVLLSAAGIAVVFGLAVPIVTGRVGLHPVAWLGEDVRVAVQEIQAGAVPIAQSAPLLLFVALGGLAVSAAADAACFALRRPAAAGLPALALALAPIPVPRAVLEPWSIVAAIAAYLLLLAVSAPPRVPRRHGGMRIAGGAAGAAVVLGLAVGLTAPGFAVHGTTVDALSRLTGPSDGTTVSSLVDLGKDLRRPTPVPVLHYTTSATTAPYLTLTTLGTFTGDTWTRTQQPIRPLGSDGQVGPTPGLEAKVPTDTVRTRVTLDDLHSSWAPAPYPASSVTGLSGLWDVGTDDLTIGTTRAASAGQRYTVLSKDVEPTPRELADSSRVYPTDVRGDLALPRSIPANITAAAKKATRGATSAYQEAVDLQSYFRDGDFTYSLQTPLREGYNGDGLAVISKFLKVKSGYCVHFASAMAIMARILGIPSRIAIGYLPGTPTADSSGTAVYTVLSDQLHSWPELYFDGIGWVRFEPTVSQGTAPSYATAATAQSTAGSASQTTQAASQPTPALETPAPTPSATASSSPTTTATGSGSAPTAPGALWVLAALILALLLLLPALAGRLRAGVGRLALARGRSPASAAWQAVRTRAVDLRLTQPQPGRSIRALAQELEGADTPAALRALRDEAERERFGGPHRDATDRAAVADALRQVRRDLARQAGRRRRLAALFAPVFRRGGTRDPRATRTILGREHRPALRLRHRRP